MKAEQALRKLIAGNLRFMSGRLEEAKDLSDQRKELAQQQHPFAVIMACSDSRVSPEILFDQGLGELFVIRTAGNVVDDVALGSIQYAVIHLHCELIMVLGHERCGAVTAAVEGSDEEGAIPVVLEAIKPAVEATVNMRGDPVDNAVKYNAQMIAAVLKKNEVLRDTEIVPARYDLDRGRVTLLTA